MARRRFPYAPYLYGDASSGFALMQERNGVHEAIFPVALWELDSDSNLYLPPGESTSPRKPRVDASGSTVILADSGSAGVKVSAEDGAIAALGALADLAQLYPDKAATVIMLLKGILKQLQGSGLGTGGVRSDTNLWRISRVPIMHSYSPFVQLKANETLTSATYSVYDYRRVVGMAFADQPGTVYIDQSYYPTTEPWFTVWQQDVTPNVPLTFDVPLYNQYVRVRYQNGPTDQTQFNLTAIVVPV